MLRTKKLICRFLAVVFLAIAAAYTPIGQLPATAQPLTICTAAGATPSTSVTLTNEEKLLADAYLRAVCDAYEPDASEVSDKLWAIATNNPKLIWYNPDKKQFRAVTWTSWPGYEGKQGSPLTLETDVWITAVPELQEFCGTLQLDPEALALRLEQYLGLPAHRGKTKFVEMWVNPSDVFRPCPDKEIDDARCEVAFPQNVEEIHKAWIETQKKSSYPEKALEKGFPWTGLGYTYDWGNLKTEIGASEFLVRKGATVTIDSIKETRQYCQPKTLISSYNP